MTPARPRASTGPAVSTSWRRRAAVLVCAAAVLGLGLTAPPASGDPLSDLTIAAVGDMACDPQNPAFNGGAGGLHACAQQRVSSQLMADSSVDSGILGLGDYQYDCDDPQDFEASYDPSWGQLDGRLDGTVAGNHEYKVGNDVYGTPCPTDNSTATGYFNHFGSVARPESHGEFSFDLGSWHLIALNANCAADGVGGCSATSAQTAWLKADLASTDKPCVLAFWHQPMWQGIGKGKVVKYKPWWDALYAAHADVVVNGHVHDYQRYAALTPSGVKDASGITEYVAGTGGEQQVAVKASVAPAPAAWTKAFGYLRMTLQANGWTSEFVDETGAVFDSTTGVCH